MNRETSTPRNGWQQAVEKLGFGFHSTDMPYWDESACYRFSMAEIESIEQATATLWEMCLEAVQHCIDTKRYPDFGIPEWIVPYLERSWNDDYPALYGRFDLAFKNGQIKLLEFNADTPTSLFEAAIIQWYWLNDAKPGHDQFNSIHEKLISTWRHLKSFLQPGPVHFTCLPDTLEDLTTTEYLRDCALQAGLDTQFLYIDELGWDTVRQVFADRDETDVRNLFKLYPWEWLLTEPFAKNILLDRNQSLWIEPSWKMLLSNKMLLAVLWKLFPNHPLLLETYANSPQHLTAYAQKPILSREGANIMLVDGSTTIEQTDGDYDASSCIYQALYTLPDFEGNHPVIGSWIIGQEPAGMGIRESNNLITGNTSRFVPHYIA